MVTADCSSPNRSKCFHSHTSGSGRFSEKNLPSGNESFISPEKISDCYSVAIHFHSAQETRTSFICSEIASRLICFLSGRLHWQRVCSDFTLNSADVKTFDQIRWVCLVSAAYLISSLPSPVPSVYFSTTRSFSILNLISYPDTSFQLTPPYLPSS